MVDAVVNGRGILTDTSIGTQGYIHTIANKDTSRPDIQIQVVPFTLEVEYGISLLDVANFGRKVFKELLEPHFGEYGALVLPTVAHPKSRGSVTPVSYTHLTLPTTPYV